MSSFPNPRIEIHQREIMLPEQLAALQKMIDLAFAAESGNPPEGENHIEWADPQVHIVAYLEGQPVGHVGLLLRKVLVGGAEVQVGGIGSVATHPNFLRRGYAHLLMELAADWMRQAREYEFGMLFCAPQTVSLYLSCGYSLIDAPLCMAQPAGRRLFDSHKMVLPLTARSWPQGEIDILGLPW